MLFVSVLKHIFEHGLGGHLDEILRLASEVIKQPSGLEMVLSLLRYIGRSAVKLDAAEMTQKLIEYLPKEGGVLMETMAQQWIEEGIDIGKREGIEEERRKIVRAMAENEFDMATIARLLAFSEEEVASLLKK